MMKIGCVTEIKKHEYRVGLTPANVHAYRSQGHQVMVQKGAGEGSGFSDQEYESMGAEILPAADEVWNGSDMIVKVKEPLAEEYRKMKEGQILYTYLHLAAGRPLTDALIERGVKGVAYETIRDAAGGLPLLKPMSEIAGRLSVQEGARCLEKPMGGMGVLLGGVPGVAKAKVVIIGGGVVGTNACKTAVGAGADVTILDKNLDRLTYLDDIFGSRIQTLYSQDAVIEKEVCGADLVIGAVLIPGAAAPKLIKKAYLSGMKKGSVIVDVAVDQGGCCETTKATYHDNPTFVVDGVLHYCVANMPGAVARSSTMALTNATLGRGLFIAGKGLEEAAKADRGIALGVNCYHGKLTCREVAESFGMAYSDIAALI
jgi:alanine dehydrogenase